MRIFTEQVLKAYAEKHPDSKVALQDGLLLLNEVSGLVLPISRKLSTL